MDRRTFYAWITNTSANEARICNRYYVFKLLLDIGQKDINLPPPHKLKLALPYAITNSFESQYKEKVYRYLQQSVAKSGSNGHKHCTVYG